MKNPVSEKFITLSYVWAAIALICGGIVYFALMFVGHGSKGFAAMLSVGISVLIIRNAWNLRSRAWFWPVIVAVFVTHAIFLGIVKFPDSRSLFGFLERAWI